MQKNKVKHTVSYKGVINVKYVDGTGVDKTVEITYPWYFVILSKDVEAAKKVLDLKTEPGFPGYSKVFLPYDSKDFIRNAVLSLENAGIKTFEGDLLPDKRWFIDKKVEIAQSFNKLYFDIETDDTAEKLEVGRDRIVSIATIDNEGHTRFFRLKDFTDESEKKMLLDFKNHIKEYDILLGWNSSGFDIPYIQMRCRKYGISTFFLSCIAKYDLLKRFRHIFRFDSQIKSFSLENISQHFLGRGKIKHEEKIIELWRDDIVKLKEYNLEDSKLVRDLDVKLGVSEMMIRQSQWCGVPPAQFGLYAIIDAFIIKKAHDNGTYVQTSINALKEREYGNTKGSENPDDEAKDKANYTGAIVLEPDIGLYDRVYVFDFKSLYPSMMRTSNIGYDSLRHEASDETMTNPGTLSIPRKAGGVKPTYFTKKLSIINLSVTELIKLRNEYKKLKLKMIEEGTNHGGEWEHVVSDEIIVKELANSTYGIMGLEYGRYFSIDVAESITLFGQWAINFAKKYFESKGYKVIYGDTDSVFVSTGKEFMDPTEQLKGFHVELKKELLKYNIEQCYIELAFDKQYERFLLVTKKTYTGHVVNIEGKKTDDIYTRGIEYIKKSTFRFAARKQKELIETILRVGMTRKQAIDFIQNARKEFYASTFTKEDLVLQAKVSKGFDEYKTKPLHVRLAEELSNRTGEKFTNVEVEYIVTSYQGKMSGVLAQDYKGTYDKDYYWDNKTLPLLIRITEPAFGITGIDDLNQSSLFP
jgi:DNA polymerase elongation subunit (family B)